MFLCICAKLCFPKMGDFFAPPKPDAASGVFTISCQRFREISQEFLLACRLHLEDVSVPRVPLIFRPEPNDLGIDGLGLA
jgi:hypothetical protein